MRPRPRIHKKVMHTLSSVNEVLEYLTTREEYLSSSDSDLLSDENEY